MTEELERRIVVTGSIMSALLSLQMRQHTRSVEGADHAVEAWELLMEQLRKEKALA